MQYNNIKYNIIINIIAVVKSYYSIHNVSIQKVPFIKLPFENKSAVF